MNNKIFVVSVLLWFLCVPFISLIGAGLSIRNLLQDRDIQRWRINLFFFAAMACLVNYMVNVTIVIWNFTDWLPVTDKTAFLVKLMETGILSSLMACVLCIIATRFRWTLFIILNIWNTAYWIIMWLCFAIVCPDC